MPYRNGRNPFEDDDLGLPDVSVAPPPNVGPSGGAVPPPQPAYTDAGQYAASVPSYGQIQQDDSYTPPSELERVILQGHAPIPLRKRVAAASIGAAAGYLNTLRRKGIAPVDMGQLSANLGNWQRGGYDTQKAEAQLLDKAREDAERVNSQSLYNRARAQELSERPAEKAAAAQAKQQEDALKAANFDLQASQAGATPYQQSPGFQAEIPPPGPLEMPQDPNALPGVGQGATVPGLNLPPKQINVAPPPKPAGLISNPISGREFNPAPRKGLVPISQADADALGVDRDENGLVDSHVLTAAAKAANTKPAHLGTQDQLLNAAALKAAQDHGIKVDTSQPILPQLPVALQATVGNDFRRDPAAEAQRSMATAIAGLTYQQKKAEVERLTAERSPENITDLATLVKDNPDLWFDKELQEKGLKPLIRRELVSRGEPVPIRKPDAQMNTTAQSATMSLQHVQQVREMLQDPDIQKVLGPIEGRIQKGEQLVGMDIPGATPEQTQKIQKFLTSVNYLFFREGRPLFGGRPPEKLMQELKATSPSPQMAPSRFAGALDAVEQGANIAINARKNWIYGANGQIPSQRNAGGAQQKIAPIARVQQYAQTKGITQAQAEAEFKASGYTIQR